MPYLITDKLLIMYIYNIKNVFFITLHAALNINSYKVVPTEEFNKIVRVNSVSYFSHDGCMKFMKYFLLLHRVLKCVTVKQKS